MPYRWYISAAALREYAQAAGHPLDDGGPQWAAAERALAALCAQARLISEEGTRQLWRVPGGDRWELSISTAPRPEGPLPQLLRVRRRGKGRGAVERRDRAKAAAHQAAMAEAAQEAPAPQPPTRGGARPGAGAPRLDPGQPARIVRAYRLLPATAQAIEAAARASGLSQGQVLDRLAAALPGPEAAR